MSGTITFSPSEGTEYATVTVTLAGFTANAGYNLAFTTPDGGSDGSPVTTDGSGAGTYVFTPDTPGTYTFTMQLAAPVVEATSAFTVVG